MRGPTVHFFSDDKSLQSIFRSTLTSIIMAVSWYSSRDLMTSSFPGSLLGVRQLYVLVVCYPRVEFFKNFTKNLF